MIKEILTTQSGSFRRTYLFRAFRKFLGNGLFTSDGAAHKTQRRLIKPAFYPQRVAGYADIMVQCAEEELTNWKAGQQLNVNEAMTHITLQVITRSMFGSRLSPELVTKAGKGLAETFEVMNRIIQNPFYTWCLIREVKIPVVRKFFRLKAEADTIINGIIAGCRKSGGDGSDLLSLLMAARDEETGTGMTDDQIRDEVMTFFVAGHETTSLALTWAWYNICRHPDVAASMQEEIRNVLGGKQPTAQDYTALHITSCIFRETLRLQPPAWTFARESTEDVTIGEYFFPQGSVLWTVTYLLHHDPRYFEQPESFIPSRWDDPAIKAIPRYAYFPFGGGHRMCIGEGFAWMEGVLVLATIASRFRMKLPDGFETEVNPVFTLKTKDPVIVTLQNA